MFADLFYIHIYVYIFYYLIYEQFVSIEGDLNSVNYVVLFISY